MTPSPCTRSLACVSACWGVPRNYIAHRSTRSSNFFIVSAEWNEGNPESTFSHHRLGKCAGKQFRGDPSQSGRLFPRHRLLRRLLCSGNRLNHHHLPHQASLHRRPLTSELVEFGLVPIQRVNLLAYDQRVLRAFLYAVSGERATVKGSLMGEMVMVESVTAAK